MTKFLVKLHPSCKLPKTFVVTHSQKVRFGNGLRHYSLPFNVVDMIRRVSLINIWALEGVAAATSCLLKWTMEGARLKEMDWLITKRQNTENDGLPPGPVAQLQAIMRSSGTNLNVYRDGNPSHASWSARHGAEVLLCYGGLPSWPTLRQPTIVNVALQCCRLYAWTVQWATGGEIYKHKTLFLTAPIVGWMPFYNY